MTPWKYFIQDDLGRYAQIQSGIVQYLGNPAWIPQTPDGWQDIALIWERNMTTYGNLRNVSLPFGFVMAGAKILRDGLYRDTVNKKLFLSIYRRILVLDDDYFRDYYEIFYRGQIDFTTAEDKQGEYRFEVNMKEGGLWNILKQKEDQVYTIPFDDDASNLYCDGLDLYGRINYLLVSQVLSGVPGQRYTLPMFEISREGNAPGAAWFEQLLENNPDIDNSQNFLLRTTIAGYYTIKGNVIIRTNSGGASGDIVLRPKESIDIEIGSYNTSVAETIYISLDYTFLSNENWTYFLLIDGASISGSIELLESNITIEYISKHPETTIRVFSPSMLFRKMVEKMTGNPDDAASVLLQSSMYYITSGDAIRGFPDAVLKTSLKDFFSSFNVYHMAGRGVENDKIIIEAREHFFKTDTPIDCGAAKQFIATPATDLMFSRITIGHAEQQIDDVNGRFAFNGQHHYGSPIEGVSNALEIVAPYKADPYEQETLRANLDGKTTTDTTDDNNLFVFHVKNSTSEFTENNIAFYDDNYIAPVPNTWPQYVGMRFTTSAPGNNGPFTIAEILPAETGYNIWRVEEAVVTDTVSPVTFTITGGVYELDRTINVSAGVPAASTIWNVALSPARLVRVHGSWLRGILKGFEGNKLVFNSTNRNYDLVAGGIVEKADIPVSSLAAPMIAPWYFEYATQVPVSIIKADLNQACSGTWGVVPFAGFPMNVGIAPNTLQEQNFRLLAVPDTDMTKFI